MEQEIKSLVRKLKSVFLKENAVDFVVYILEHKDEEIGDFKEWVKGYDETKEGEYRKIFERIRKNNIDLNILHSFLIKEYKDVGGKLAGEFFTPPEFSKLMAKIVLHLQPLESGKTYKVVDWCCGSGSLLIAFLEEAYSIIEKQGLKGVNFEVFGCDVNERSVRHCDIGLSKFKEIKKVLEVKNGLNVFKTICAEIDLNDYDYILGNPPFNLKFDVNYYKRITDYFPIIPKGRGDLLFVYRSLKSIEKGGVGAFILYPSLLTFSSLQGIRDRLLEIGVVVSVSLLEGKSFLNTPIKVILLVLKKGYNGKGFSNECCNFEEWLQGGQILEIGKDWSIIKEVEKEVSDIKAVTSEVARLTEFNNRQRQKWDELVAKLELFNIF